MIKPIYEHKDHQGDSLDVSRITESSSGPGVTFGATDRHGHRVAAFLADVEAVEMLERLARILGYDLTAPAGDQS